MFKLMERSPKPGEVSGETRSDKPEGGSNGAHSCATCWHEEGLLAWRKVGAMGMDHKPASSPTCLFVTDKLSPLDDVLNWGT